MAKAATIDARAEPGLRTVAEAAVVELGLTPTEAITLFCREVVRKREVTFQLDCRVGALRGMSETSTANRSLASQPQAGPSFLAEASRLLADSLEYEATLATVAGLSLPYSGAWCIVDLCMAGEMRRAAVIHADPDMQALARGLESRWPPEQDDPFGVPGAVRTRKTEVIADVPDMMLAEVSRGEENLEILRSLGIESLLVVPLLARGAEEAVN